MKRTEHQKKFDDLCDKLGIGWTEGNPRFMGRTIEEWVELYQEDEHLNNVPLKEFDSYYPWHRTAAARCRLNWPMSYTVCCLKRVIERKVTAYLEDKS